MDKQKHLETNVRAIISKPNAYWHKMFGSNLGTECPGRMLPTPQKGPNIYKKIEIKTRNFSKISTINQSISTAQNPGFHSHDKDKES